MPEQAFVPGVDPGLKAWLRMRQEVRDARSKGTNTYSITSEISYKYHYHWIDLLFGFEEKDFQNLTETNKVDDHSWAKVQCQNICNNDEYDELLRHPIEGNLEKLYYYAIYHRSQVLLEKLIDQNGYNIDYKFTTLQRTLLQLAVQLGDERKVEYLLRKGADPSIVDLKQRTALHLSIHSESRFHALTIPTRLIELYRGAVNAQDCFGRTPLHYACLVGNSKLARLLLENQANMTIQDEKKKMPMDYTSNRDILAVFAEFAKSHGRRQQYLKVQARFVARSFVNDIFQVIQPKCSVCKRTLGNCNALKTSNYRYWMHAHSRFKKEMYKPKGKTDL